MGKLTRLHACIHTDTVLHPIVESTLTSSIIVWYNESRSRDKLRLQCSVHSAYQLYPSIPAGSVQLQDSEMCRLNQNRPFQPLTVRRG